MRRPKLADMNPELTEDDGDLPADQAISKIAADDLPHPEDQVLDGYRLLRFLGRGGFGDVWLCRSEAMGDYRALKLIPASSPDHLAKEYEALQHYRNAAARLSSPHLAAIEHVNRDATRLYYVMPLADGIQDGDPTDPAWQPLSLATRIQSRASEPTWFSSQEIIALLQPILLALHTLSEAGLVHRDVKPENILFFNGVPCLSDISLLGVDAACITRRGTPGYATPSWYEGGHPDMYSVAATLYTLLTGNSADKMGRAAFLWPPQGEPSLSKSERTEWRRLHALVHRASEEKVTERFLNFPAMATALSGGNGLGHRQRRSRLPQGAILILVFCGLAVATIAVAYRGKWFGQQPPLPPPTAEIGSTQSATQARLPELTSKQADDYTALAVMAQSYLEERNYASALAAVETLLATYPQSRKQPVHSIFRAMALKGLGRRDEAKIELKRDINVSPEVSAMSVRKGLWEALGDLEAAETDLSLILNKFGPVTFTLFLRADIRAQQNNFAGVQADREVAYTASHDPDQGKLVDSLWSPLATKYPGYGDYLARHPKK